MIFSWFEQVATMVSENRSYRKQVENIHVGGQTMGQKWKKWMKATSIWRRLVPYVWKDVSICFNQE
jgi:hypothetical protein